MHQRAELVAMNVPVALAETFGNTRLAYYSLYASVTGGISWGLVFQPLYDYLSPQWIYSNLFILFISVTFFGMLNVITAVFIESAMQATSEHRDIIVQEKKQKEGIYVAHIKSIFQEIDSDKSGQISMLEIEQLFGDENLSELLEALEISAYDARSMFKLLDGDDSGAVDIDEFCSGCLRLKGDARSFDIQCLMFESQRLLKKTTTLMGHWEATIVDLKETMNHNEASLRKSMNAVKSSVKPFPTKSRSSRDHMPDSCTTEGSSELIVLPPRFILPHLHP